MGTPCLGPLIMNRICKRTLDLILAIIGLIIAAPLMAVIALLVWLDSRGNVIFAQKRLGLQGKPFWLYKFRKFPVHWGEAGPGVTMANDVRMTPIGTILERTKLDELPQLWNILKGEMSCVGPRPESTRFADLFTGNYAAVLAQIPGIFGPTQFVLTDETELYPPEEDPEAYYRRVLFPQKAEIDLAYAEKAHCLRDIGWIVSGVGATLVSMIHWQRFVEVYAKILLVDSVLIESAWIVTNLLRFSGLPDGKDLDAFIIGLWILPPLIIISMSIGGCYRHPVRYFSLTDALHLTGVVSLAWLLGFIAIMGYASRSASLYLVPMGWSILLILLAMPRVWRRVHWDKIPAAGSEVSRQVLIYGTGIAGIALATWMKHVPLGLNLLGFLDDDPQLRGNRIAGYRILGRERDIATIRQRYLLDEIWVTFEADELKRRRLQTVCQQQHIKLIALTELAPFSSPAAPDVGVADSSSKAWGP